MKKDPLLRVYYAALKKAPQDGNTVEQLQPLDTVRALRHPLFDAYADVQALGLITLIYHNKRANG